MSSETPLDRVAVALDTSDRQQFAHWCAFFGPRVGMLKVGLEAFCHWGLPAVEEAVRHARRVFLDLKLHDIPNTVAGATRIVRDSGARYLTVHAAGGAAMVNAAVEAAGSELAILAVTLLTHLDEASLEELDLGGERTARAVRWAQLAARAGAGGAVCSALEVEAVRAVSPQPFVLVTPGIRWDVTEADDQRRVASPEGALRAGADFLVVGRPLTKAVDPEAALEELERRLRQTQGPPRC